MSFLEMLDVLNEDLIAKGEEPIAFDHDCREGICGMCGFMINGMAHGPQRGTTVCQLHMRHFKDGDELYLEPWRAARVPGDQGPGGGPHARSTASSRPAAIISAHTGSAPDGNAILVPKDDAELSMDAAACIGCGACVAMCPNALGGAVHRRQDRAPGPAAARPARARPARHGHGGAGRTREAFGSCTNIGECEAVCPKEIKLEVIARMNRDFIRASLNGR